MKINKVTINFYIIKKQYKLIINNICKDKKLQFILNKYAIYTI